MRILVTGKGGRMGDQVVHLIEEAADLSLAGVVGIGESLEAFVGQADVLIDFTAPEATVAYAAWCAEHGVAFVTGTTGMNEEQDMALAQSAGSIPLLWAPNMSVGVNLLFDLAARSTEALGSDADIEIVESHHRHKKDAPSGTALRLADVIADARSVSLDEVGRFERHGLIGERSEGEIGIQTLRGGDVVGEHTATFFLEGERIELTHRATDRAIFARGAIRAARWLVGRPAGLYSMKDVLAS